MVERHVEIPTNRGVIRGMFHCVAGAEVVVLLLHGYFSSHRVGPCRLYVRIARALATAGYSVFRPDAWGVGDSDGDFQDVTLDTEVEDFVRCGDWLREATRVSSLVLVGHSMGANLALLVSEKLRPSGLVLLAPEVRFPMGVDTLLDERQREDLAGPQGGTFRKGIWVSAAFVHELRRSSAMDAARFVRAPTTVVQGTDDELYDPGGAADLVGAMEHARLVKIPGADHNFLYPEGSDLVVEEVVSAIQWAVDRRSVHEGQAMSDHLGG